MVWFRRRRQQVVSDEVKIKIKGYATLAEPTRKAVEDSVHAYAFELVDEAGRLEANARGHRGGALITPKHIEHADLQVRNGFTPRVGGQRYTILDSVAFAAAIAAGVFGGNLKESWGPIGLVLSAIIGVIAYWTRGTK